MPDRDAPDRPRPNVRSSRAARRQDRTKEHLISSNQSIGVEHPDPSDVRRTTSDRSGSTDTLRIRVVSDLIGSTLHDGIAPAQSFDIVVAAGDTGGSPFDAVRRLREAFPTPVPVVMVLGERDLAGGDYEASVSRAKSAARDLGVILLENEATVVGGVRFVGACFWTDFRLSGEGVPSMEAAMEAAETSFRALNIRKGHQRRFDPYASMWEHARSKVALTLALRDRFAGPTVVVTHHAPSALCISAGMVDDPMASTLASRCDDLVRSSGAALWIHGHVPDPVDVVIGETRVVAAPHGQGRQSIVVGIR